MLLYEASSTLIQPLSQKYSLSFRTNIRIRTFLAFCSSTGIVIMASHSKDFYKYRDMAPASVPDQRIEQLIEFSNGDAAAITLGIENMWHDIPDAEAVAGSEWDVTPTEKRKAKKKIDVVPEHKSKTKDGRDHREKSAAGDRNGAKSAKPVGPKAAPQSAANKGPAVISDPIVAISVEPVQELVLEKPAVRPPRNSQSTSQWTSAPITFAERLKAAEAAKAAEALKAAEAAKIAVAIKNVSADEVN